MDSSRSLSPLSRWDGWRNRRVEKDWVVVVGWEVEEVGGRKESEIMDKGLNWEEFSFTG